MPTVSAPSAAWMSSERMCGLATPHAGRPSSHTRLPATTRAASPARDVPATPGSSLAAADPGGSAKDRALLAHLERPKGAVVERHLLTAGRRVRGPVLPVEPGAGARGVVVALLEDRRRTVDRPEGSDGVPLNVLQAGKVTRRRCTLQLAVRACLGAGEVRVARGVGARQA